MPLDSGKETATTPSREKAEEDKTPLSPYSPTHPTDDWSTNLAGVKHMLAGSSDVTAMDIDDDQQAAGEGSGRQTLEVPPEAGPSSSMAKKSNANKDSQKTSGQISEVAGQRTHEVLTGEKDKKSCSDSTQHQPGADVVVRAKQFVLEHKKRAAEEKAAKMAKMLEYLKEDKLAYNVVLKASSGALSAPDLRTGADVAAPDTGSFYSEADGRITRTEVKVVLGQKKTWSNSLQTATFECLGCKKHVNWQAFPRKGSSTRSGLQTIWLGDQSIPAMLPTDSDMGCVKIFRLENGSVIDLAEGLINMMKGRQLSAGSVVLLTSLSNMASAGTAGYISDLVEAIRLLKKELGDHVLYGPLPNFMMNGCNDEATIRTNLEVGAWARSMSSGGGGSEGAIIADSFLHVEQQMQCRGEGGQLTNYRCRLRLPTTLSSSLKTGTWESANWSPFCVKVRPPTVKEESDTVKVLLEETRDKFAINLDTEPLIERHILGQAGSSGDGGGLQKSFLVAGSSHGGKVAAALRELGHTTTVIYSPNWRAFKNSAWELAENIRDKMETTQVDCAVLAILDNNLYFALPSCGDGVPIPESRAVDGRYHVDGDLVVAGKTSQQVLFNNLKPIFDAISPKNIILMGPLPRYVNGACCGDPEHAPNVHSATFESNLKAELKDVVANFKEFAFRAKYKNMIVLDPSISMRNLSKDDIWLRDPVHPEKLAYRKIAEGVVLLAERQFQAGTKRQRSDTGGPHRADSTGGGSGEGQSGAEAESGPSRKVVFREGSWQGGRGGGQSSQSSGRSSTRGGRNGGGQSGRQSAF
jgi:hypothetical protein